MRKLYPYLDNPWGINYNDQQEDRNFLKQIDNFVNQKQYVRITLLNWNEDGIKEIEGELTNGSITKDSASTVRRTCTLSCSVNGGEYTAEDAEMDFAINKKIYLEIGIKNYTDQYPEYPFLWFPQGVFFISTFNIQTSSNSAVNISLQLKDKMAGLNGEVGGTIPATTILDEMDTQAPSGEYITEKVLIYDIIVEVVNHFGGEILSNIVIEDVPKRIQRVMKWTGSNPLWMKQQGNIDSGIYYDVSLDEPSDTTGWYQYVAGDDVGYIYDDFVYTDELTAAPGDSVTTILDQIVSYLGNYEYFYDEFGIFHFREIKNYLNTTQATMVSMAKENGNYLTSVTTPKSTFSFSDDTNLVTLNINPQYGNIKNDYIVQGTKKMKDLGIDYPVRYHLAIDYKPRVGNTYRDLLLYREEDSQLIKAQFPLHVDELPEVGNFNIIYCAGNDTSQFFYWDDTTYKPIEIVKYYPRGENTEGYVTKDWRTEIYLRGLLAKNNGTDASQYFTNLQHGKRPGGQSFPWLDDIFNISKHEKIDVDFYYEELCAFWPEIYDLENQKFWAEEKDLSVQHTALTDGNWFLDFIDPSTSGLGEFCISNIGRRTQVTNKDTINCLFEPVFPNVVFINIDDDGAEEAREECINSGQPYTQIHGEIYWAMATGGYNVACYDEIKYQLYLHTNYQKTVSIIAIPAFYLEPNTRVRIDDNTTNTHGDFVVSNITIPLGAGNTMSVAASEASMDRYF